MDERSVKNLQGVNEQLVGVIKHAYEHTRMPFIVTEGLRSAERQKQLYAEKKTKTLKSKHLLGRAVDIVPTPNGKVSWEKKDFLPVVEAIKASAALLDVKIECGYDWGWDAPHIELKD